jgi:hypothetical protein
LYRVHDARQKDLEIPVGLALMQPLQISSLGTSRVNDDLTVVTDDQRGSGQQLLFGNCTLNLKASIFVMVVLRSMWRRSPWIILRLLSTRTIVVLLILNSGKDRGIV